MSSNFPNIPDSSVPGQLAHVQPPESWIYDRDPANGIARATFNGEVYAQTINSPAAGVSAFNGRTGSVTLDLADVEAAGGAPLASPAFTGNPTVPTAAPGTSTTEAASTAYVMQAVQAGAGVATFNGRSGAVILTATDITSAGGLANPSPALTGNATSTTQAVSDNSSNIATTAFVNNWGAQNTVLSFNGRRGAVTLSLTDVESVGGAPILSPSFTGVPIGPTAAPGTATGQLATTAFVTDALVAGTAGVSSFNTRTGAVTLTTADITNAGGLPSVSGAMTGVPTAPTASAGTNSNQIATCAFVETAVSDMAPVVSSWNGRTGAVTLALADVTAVGGAPLASPVLTGTPAAPEPTLGDNSTRIATTSFIAGTLANYVTQTSLSGQLANYLPLAGGIMTGNITMGANTITGTGSVNMGQSTIGGVVLSGGEVTTGSSGVNINNTALLTAASGNMTISSPSGGAFSNLQILAATTLVNGNLEMIGTNLYPGNNNALNCGFPGQAWFQVASYNFPNESARELKREIEPLGIGLATVAQINPVQFYWKDGPDQENQHLGFLADEVNTVLGEGTAPGARAINTNELVAVLWKAVQELNAEVEELKNERHSRGHTERARRH